MAKQRLVDFRGGLNSLISPHMIGDSQGEDALNVDLSAVRLQGRLEIDPSSKAEGSFFYEYGNVSDASVEGRWVSIHPEDTDTYLAGATDFAVWNKDLYVAYGEDSTDGKLRVYRDSADVAEVLDFDEPSSLSIATYNASVTSEFLTPTETLIDSVAGVTSVPAVSGAHPVTDINEVDTSDAVKNYYYTDFTANPYTLVGANANHNNRQEYTQTVNGVTTSYYENNDANSSSYKRLQEVTSTSTENISYYWNRHKLTDYPYSSGTNNQWHQFYLSGTGRYLTLTVGGTNYLFMGGAYTSTAGRAGTWNSHFYAYLNVSLSNGDLYEMQTGGEFLKTGTTSTYLADADVLDIVHVRFQGTSGNNMSLPTSDVQFFRTSNTGAAVNSNSTGYYYDFAKMDDTYGTGEWRDQQQNVLHSIPNIGADVSSIYTSGGWNYNIPSTSVTPSYLNPPNTSRTGNTIQSFYYLTTRVSYVYADQTDTIPAVTAVPETPAFTYDNARSKIYLEYTSNSDVGAEDTDNAQGTQWLVNRDFSLTDNGYYLKTVRESNNLPQVSNTSLKATLASNNSYVLGESLANTPQRLNFTIGTPADNATAGSPLRGYKLERRDSISAVDLGYISPDTGVSFSYSNSTKEISITLPTSTTAKYRLKFSGYQNTHVQINSLSAVKSNMSGFTFTGSSNVPTITLIPQDGASQQFYAADFWLERVIIDGATSADDIYATVRCFDVFDRNGNAIAAGAIEGTSDFLDVFPNGLSSGALTDSGAEEGVPTYLKFLRESNNFFFAVGTPSTPDNRYSSTNKADSYLFISEYNNPRSWPLSGYLEFDSSITGLASYPGELIVFTEGGVYRVTGSRFDQMRKTKLATTEGLPALQHRSIALVNRYLCWVSQTGICIYNGESVTNITRGRIENFNLTGSSVHAGQFEDVYYVVNSSETGYSVDFSLEGFPVSRIDLREGSTTTPSNSANPAQVFPPVLVYRPSVNRLYSRRGIVEGGNNRNLWTFKTRGFDGGAFGSIKLVRNVTVNGTGSGKIQIYLDGEPVFYSIDPNPPFEYSTANNYDTYLKKVSVYYTSSGSTNTTYTLYYRGELITASGPSKSEGTSWESNDSEYNFTFSSSAESTVTTQTGVTYLFGNAYPVYTTTAFYSVRNNILTVPIPKTVNITSATRTEPARVYLPASPPDTQYGLSMADVWTVEITDWNGRIDWIDTEYEIIAGG